MDRTNDWELVLLEIESDDAYPFYAHGVLLGDSSVGVVTSAAVGHRVGKNLAFAYLREATARDGLRVDILGKHHPAKILDEPPFDPTNQRLRSGGTQ